MGQRATLYMCSQLILVFILLNLPTSSLGQTSPPPSSQLTADSEIESLRSAIEEQTLHTAELSSELDSMKADLQVIKQDSLSGAQIRRDAENSTWWALWTLRLLGAISIIVLGASIGGTIYGIYAGRSVQQDVASVRETRRILETELAQIRTAGKQMRDEYENVLTGFERFYESFDFSAYEQDYINKKDELVFQDFDIRVTMGEVMGHKPSLEDYEKMAKFHHRANNWGRALLRIEQALAMSPNSPWSNYIKAVSLGSLAKQELNPEIKEEFLGESRVHALRATRLLEGKNDEGEWMGYFGLGWVQTSLREFKEAIVSYHRAASLGADFPGIPYNIAICVCELGRFEDTEGMLEQALGFPENREMLAEGGERDFSSALKDGVYGPRIRRLIDEASTS